MLKQNLQQKLGLKINPLQIQLIKLLELPTYQLEQRIKEELESNPLLEEGDERMEQEVDFKEGDDDPDLSEMEGGEDDYDRSDDEFSLEDYMSDDDDMPDYRLSTSNASRDDESREFIITGGESFREELLRQLGVKSLPDLDRKVSEYIIGNIDDDGYLRRDVDSIVDDLAFGAGVEISGEKVLALLHMIQGFDPAGVGARDLRECLLLQVRRRIAENPTPALQNAKMILELYFDEFSKKHYEKLGKRAKLSDKELKEAVDVILKLNPKPGGGISDSSVAGAEKIIPDFILDMEDGELQLSLNTGNIPELRLNKSYINLLDEYQKKASSSREKKDVVSFVKYKLTSARSFIDAVQQRNNTLMLTMTAIVQFQKEFFETGDESKLKPMILRDIADITGLDVSTVSRVSNSKYVQTWFGIYALKQFFTGSMTTSSGEEVSTGELKNVLKEIVDGEDKKKPYTDDELVDLMKAKGYQIARRTIAKYRQLLDIPVARLRREV